MTDNYSHSRLEVARKCMQQFKFQYIDKIKIDDPDTSAVDFGSFVHTIAENYKGGGKPELLKLYHDLIPSVKLTDAYKKKVPLALENIHSVWTSVLKEAKEVHHEADIKIELNESIAVNGKIDIYLVQQNDRIKIVDYKTNKSNKYADHKNQLAMYMLLLNKEYGIPYDKMDCEIIYLTLDSETKYKQKIENKGYENISKSYKLDETDVYCLTQEIETIHAAIKKSIEKNSWSANPNKFNCTYCKFNTLCDKKWVDSEIV